MNEQGDKRRAYAGHVAFQKVFLQRYSKKGDNESIYTGNIFVNNHAIILSKAGKKLLCIFIIIIMATAAAAFSCFLIAFIKISQLESESDGQDFNSMHDSFKQSITDIWQAISRSSNAPDNQSITDIWHTISQLNDRGVIYIRWGRTLCPLIEGSKLIYSGFAGGTNFYFDGGGSNYLCMIRHPEYDSSLTYRPGRGFAFINGAEYRRPTHGHTFDNVPCAVCHVSNRTSVMMIPAKASCPPTWTREYYGYLMTQHIGSSFRRNMFECVDEALEPIPDSRASHGGAYFYHVHASCGRGLSCPPYIRIKELNCVVCTK